MDAQDIRKQSLKISTLLSELDELLTPDKMHLAPAHAMLIKEESEKLNRMIWRA